MKILFVCEGNVNRSQMAATFMHDVAPDLDVSSAGTLVKLEDNAQQLSTLSKKGIEVMKEMGFDMSNNFMRQLTPAMVHDADHVILMGDTPGGPLPEYLAKSTKLEKWNVPDPGYGEIGYVEARDSIRTQVEVLAKSLTEGR
jgi:protein-tyrosine-phosphatase